MWYALSVEHYTLNLRSSLHSPIMLKSLGCAAFKEKWNLLPDLNDPPEQMLHLLRHVNNAPFWENFCQYNSAFVFTSVGVKSDESITQLSGPYAFKIHGGLYYRSGALVQEEGQGQSVKHIGLDLHVPVFSHGQLYVALFHCTSKDHIKILLPAEANGQTPNIVYNGVLNGVANGMLSSVLV